MHGSVWRKLNTKEVMMRRRRVPHDVLGADRNSVRFDELCREVIIGDKGGPLHVVFTCMEDAWNHVYHTSVHVATKGQQRAGSDRHCFARLGPVRGPFGVNQKAKGAQV